MNYMEEHKEFFEKLLTMLEEQYGPIMRSYCTI